MAGKLDGKKIAIVATDGVEQIELTSPKEALEREGAYVEIVSPKEDVVKGWNHTQWGDTLEVDCPIRDADADDYDALVLPGGVMSPDKLRVIPEVQRFVRSFFEDGKPVAAICHGPWTLIDARAVDGRKLTSWPTLRTDLINAGADWVDQEVVVDGGLVTSRKPDDLAAFNAAIVEVFARGEHGKRRHAARGERPPAP